MHATIDQSHGLEPIDPLAGTHRIDSEPFCKPMLIKARQRSPRGQRIRPA
jgi:hypothetical protein